MRWSIVFPAVLLAASCDEPGVHILTAQLYEPAGACLTASQGVDVVNGPSTGDNCNPTCLTIASSGTTSVYLTPMCPPFPGDYHVEAADAATDPADPCTGAFAALAAYDDSGVTCPPITDDGGDEGGDAGAGMGDAGADVGTDAATDAPATD
jgi:hypothetical protein